MTKEDLLTICNDQIKVLGDLANVSLILPGKWEKTSFRRLCPGGPIGNIVSDNFNGHGIIVLFNARELKYYLSDKPNPGHSMFWQWLYWQVDASTTKTWIMGDTLADFLHWDFVDPHSTQP